MALLLLIALSACGLRPASSFVPPVEAGSIKPIPTLEGVPIRVTSKEFTEQLVLGKMAVLALAAAGADVTDKTNVQGSVNARASLIRGGADVMWEYTGTGWITYLGQSKPIPDPHEQYVAVRDLDLRENGIVWLPPSAINNSYSIGMTRATSEKYGVTKLSEMTKIPVAERTYCVDHEAFGRDDGFLGMLKGYGLRYGTDVPAANVKRMSVGILYNSIASGQCAMGLISTTDGRIPALGLVLLEDDKHFFPQYNAGITLRKQLFDAHPEIAKIFAPISAKLNNDVMQKLNAKVDVDGGDPALVARDWLRSEGFVK